MSDSSGSSHPSAGFLGRVVGHASTVLVLTFLGAVAWWGHHTGWQAPALSRVLDRTDVASGEDWCPEHNVPESACLACNPELGGADPADWCREHGVPESRCTICHPEILTRGQADDWCGEHGVPESQCTLCNPQIAIQGVPPQATPQGTGAQVQVLQAPDALEGPDPACQTHQVRVQFASAAAVDKAGVRLESVQERPMPQHVSAPGEVAYDATLVARLASRAAGTVWRVDKDLGQTVRAGEVLALVEAAEVGRARAAFLQAWVDVASRERLGESLDALEAAAGALAEASARAVERLRVAVEEGHRSLSDLQEAEAADAEAGMALAERQAQRQEAAAALREARIRLLASRQALANLGLPVGLHDLAGLSEEDIAGRLRVLGLSPEVRETLGDAATAGLVPVVAPFDGVVVERTVVAGEAVDASAPLFTVADTRRMWVLLDLRQEDAAGLALGQQVRFRPDAAPAGAVQGRVAWIGTRLDPRTRTLQVRAQVDNAGGDLRAGAFGTGRILVRESPRAVAVLAEAVHWEGCCHVVFVRRSDTVFQVRKLRLGGRDGPWTEVLAGLLPGEVVATAGSQVLKSELLKSWLGAGCADE